MLLGLSFGFHDSAAALIDDSRILFADHEERYSRQKFDPNFPASVIKEIANNFDLSLLSGIAYYEKPIPKLERQLFQIINGSWRDTGAVINNATNLRKYFNSTPNRIKKLIHKAANIDLSSIPVFYSKHHLSHASSTFFTSDFESATVLVMDAVGEWNSTTAWVGSGNHLRNIWAQRFPHSIGLFYSAMTQYLGFKVNSGEYKLMGLAPYGKPIFLREFDNIIRIHEDGSLNLNLKMFNFISGASMISERLESHFGMPTRGSNQEITQRHADMAATTQAILENYVFVLLKALKSRAEIKNLCLSGGVALNCVLNEKIADEIGPENLHIFPAAGDAGGAVGAALAVSLSKRTELPMVRYTISNGALGRSFSKNEIREALQHEKIAFEEMTESEVVRTAARMISQGKVVAVFSGKSEFGPRALGNRSILADPRIKLGQIHINRKIKFRESFRPFAPICLLEEQENWFAGSDKSEFMLRTVPVKSFLSSQDYKSPSDSDYDTPINISERISAISSQIPSVTHLDGSARIQTVDFNDGRLTTKILRQFYQITGCPVLINTSFNVRGEPIVGTPQNAVNCFATTGIDALVFDNFIALKESQSKTLSARYQSAVGDD